jgi:hypothetical protein
MKTLKKIELAILNLKLITENLEIAEFELKEGNNDLHFRLSHFRKRVAAKDKEKYDLQFFGIEKKEKQFKNSKKSELKIFKESKIDLKIPRSKNNRWIKKIYRKIVSSTHPDKFANFPVVAIKEKYLKIYRKTVAAFNDEEDDQVLLCAYETDIEIDDPRALPILQKGNKLKNNRYKEIQNLLAYQWYHVPNEKREKTLENYLKQLGYEFTLSEIKDVVQIARKRKVGTRPKNLRKLKNVK